MNYELEAEMLGLGPSYKAEDLRIFILEPSKSKC